MNDPERLLPAGWTNFETAMIRSGKSEKPPQHSKQRAMLALGLGGAVVSSVAPAAAASGAAGVSLVVGSKAGVGLLIGKWVGLGALLGGMAWGARVLVSPIAKGTGTSGDAMPSRSTAVDRGLPQSAEPRAAEARESLAARDDGISRGEPLELQQQAGDREQEPIRRLPSSRSGPPRPVSNPAPRPLAEPQSPALPAAGGSRSSTLPTVLPTVESQSQPVPHQDPPSPAARLTGQGPPLPAAGSERTALPAQEPPRRPPLLASATLVEELLELDRARSDTAAGAPQRALARLRDYETLFPNPRLLDEARVVRVQALLAARRAPEAAREGEAFLREHPHSPYAARMRSLIQEAHQP